MRIAHTLILFLYFSLSLSAQVGDYRNTLSIGGNLGVTMNTINFSPTIKQSSKIFPTAGLSCRYISEKYFSSICGVLVEFNYANLGWKELIEDGSGNTYSHSIHYLQMPMMMQMGWGKEQAGFKFVFEAGPQIGIAFGTGESRGGGIWDPSHRPNNVVYQYDNDIDNRFDYGIIGGLGIEYSKGRHHYTLEGRYYFGLGDTYDNSKHGYFSRSANQTIEIKIGYLYDLDI